MTNLITAGQVLFLWMLPYYRAESDGVFECGAHGRFEYCIDGIPGCVIGCHCHPGYYFDTESKICEPNTKLTLNYRRHYVPEPTRVQSPTFFSNIEQTELVPTLTTHNIIDEHVNAITKNADDLGDWLYNQFFKTIENQVINKTNKDSRLTRRSGQGSLPKNNKLKRRARRKGNKHKKKKKGSRGKLLRITEDDSLFESSDSSEPDSGNSERSDSSLESDSDEDHGHKKILLINKKPRPPLPSFIFLPNMNTPYYPPIGLPPPPVMPMYPLVPVPPMMPAPPIMQFPGYVPECDEKATPAKTETSILTTTVRSTEKLETNTTAVITTKVVTTTATPSEAPSTTNASALRSRYKGRKRKKIKPQENIADDYEEIPSDVYDPTRESRNKLINLLRQRMNYPRIDGQSFKKHKKTFNKNINQLIPPDTLINNDLTDEAFMYDVNSTPANLENTSEVENVDFKYLSQLIHRVNENQTLDVPPYHYNLNVSPKTITPHKLSAKRYNDFSVPLDSSRRKYQERMISTSRNHETDDTYYSNLGRQIAALIRTIDADKERQFNIEIEKIQQKPNEQPYFNENGPRTFWERSVRSPLAFLQSFKNRFNKHKNSDEILFNIESKVETMASTVPTLSLHELENLINVMQAARTRLRSNTSMKNVQPPNRTFNVNLWPREEKHSEKFINNPTNSNMFNIKRIKATNYLNTGRELLKTESNNINNPYPLTNRMKLHKVNDVYIKRGLEVEPDTRNITKAPNPRNLPNSRNLSSGKRRYEMNPNVHSYKKYFFDNNNEYSFQNDDLPLQYPFVSRAKQQVRPLLLSPYFHHETNHVDYIS